MATSDAVDVGQSTVTTILLHDGSGSVLVPEPETLFLGDYARHGSDLVITHDGTSTYVVGYFAASTSPSLSAPNGAFLTADVVSALAGPQAPGQYAQVGGQSALVEIGKILTLTGSASATHADGVKVQLAVGDVVYQGDVVQTGPDSKLGVSFLDESLFSMSANGRMVLDELVYDPAKAEDSSMVINLVQGSFVFVTGAIAPTGNMKIETPVATMGIRGTTPKVVISTELGVTEFSILPDPDSGKVGSYLIIDKSSGEILGTVESVGDKWVVNTLSNEAVKIAKSGLDLLEDEIAMSDIREVVSHALGERTQLNGTGSFQQVSYDSNAGNGGDEGSNSDGSGGHVPGGDQTSDDGAPDVDDPPVAIDDVYAVHEDVSLVENVIGLAKPAGSPGKDFDPDGFNTLLAVTEVNGVPLVFNASGVASVVLPVDAPDQTVGANLLIRASGGFTFDPSSAFDFLAAGEFRTETFTYTLRDKGGYTDTATVTITIEGRNDTPIITAIDVEGSIFDVAETDPTQEGVSLNTAGSITFADVDLTNRPVATEATKSIVWLGQAGQPAPPELTAAQKAAIENAFTITNVTGNTNNGTVTWDYTINENTIDFLGAGEKVVVVFTITVDDGYTGSNPRVGTATQDVTITIFGATEGADNNDAPVITVVAADGDLAAAGLTETNATLSVTGTLTVTEVDLTDEIDLSVVSVTPSGSTGPLPGQPDNATLKAMLSLTPSPILTDTSSTHTQFSWYFNSGAVNFDYLAEGETLVLTYVVRATDDQNASDDQPVTITITGTNDVPVITTQDLVGGVTELVTPSGNLTDTGTIEFNDVDLTDTHVVNAIAAPSVVPSAGVTIPGGGPLGTFTASVTTQTDADGPGGAAPDGVGGVVTWNFQVAASAVEFLAEGESVTQTYTVVLNDQNSLNNTVTREVVITITGTNDQPVITTQDLVGGVTELVTPSGNLTDTGTIEFNDVDLTDTHVVNAIAAPSVVPSAGVTIPGGGPLGTFTASVTTQTDADGPGGAAPDGVGGVVTWNFQVAASAVEFLAEGESVTQTYTVVLNDQNSLNNTVTREVVITITGTNDQPVIEGTSVLADTIAEQTNLTGDATDLTATGQIVLSDVDLTDTHTTSKSFVSAVWSNGSDPTVDPGVLVIDPVNQGADTAGWTYTVADRALDFLAAGETLTITYDVTVKDDSGVTANDTSVSRQIVITITGTNDQPVIEGTSVLADTIAEQTNLTGDATDLTATGQIVLSDVDLTDTHTTSKSFVSAVWSNGSDPTVDPGVLAIDPVNQGADTAGWTYTVADSALDFLAAGETLTITYDVTVKDDSGVTANDTSVSRQIVITITGTNDQPVIEGTSVLADTIAEQTNLTGDATDLTATGQIVLSDVDLTDTHTTSKSFVSAVWSNGSDPTVDPGVLAIDPVNQGADTAGWTYTVADSALDFLAAGETLTITYDVTVKDDSGVTANDTSVSRQIVITITGTNDQPVITAEDLVGGVTELLTPAGNLTDTGTISFADADLTDTHVIAPAVTASAGALGILTASVTSDTTGSGTGGQITWNYTVAAAAVEYLAADETKVETFTITLDDGHGGTVERTITITITGTNDDPVVAAGDAEFAVGFDGADDGISSAGFGAVTLVGPEDEGHVGTPDGSGHALFDHGVDNTVGPFTDFGGYSSAWNGDWTTTAVVYLDIGWAAGEGFDYSVAANGTDGSHQRDFIFHVTMDSSTGELLVGGSNNSGAGPREDIESLDHGVIAGSGWYTFEHQFHDVDGILVVDLTLIDATGHLVWSTTLSNPEDTIGGPDATVGGNRYGWFPVLSVSGGLAVDGLSLNVTDAMVGELADGDPGENATTHLVEGQIAFIDADLSDSHAVNFQPAGAGYLGDFSVMIEPGDEATGDGAGRISWNFTVSDAAIDHLGAGETLVQTYRVTVDDGHGGADSQTVTVAITGTNDVPVVTAGATLEYGWNDGAQVIDASITVADVDNAQFVGATVSIGTGYVEGEDFLGFVDGGGITGSFNAATGELVLSGAASKAAYQDALRSVTYLNISDDPSPDDRTISFSVYDGEGESLAATSTVSITPFNDIFGDAFAASADTLNGTTSSDRIYGLEDNDVLFGFDGNDQLFGGNGNDDLHDGEGDDLLDGGAGEDQLFGGEGSDVLIGGDGVDQLTGNGGADQFVFLANTLGDPLEADIVLDYSLADGDVINLDNLLSGTFDPEDPHQEIALVEGNSATEAILRVSDGSGGWDDVAVLDGVNYTSDTIHIFYEQSEIIAFSNVSA